MPTSDLCGGGDVLYQAAMQNAVEMWQQAFPGYPVSGSPGNYCGGIALIGSPPWLPQIFSTVWAADYADPQDWLSLQVGPSALNNLGAVNVPTANTIMTEADQELDPTVRTALYNQAEQLLVQSVAWIPLAQNRAFYDVRSSVAHFGLAGLGYPSLDQLYAIELVKR
jgi:ABC-type transport system substrate-binding protein